MKSEEKNLQKLLKAVRACLGIFNRFFRSDSERTVRFDVRSLRGKVWKLEMRVATRRSGQFRNQ